MIHRALFTLGLCLFTLASCTTLDAYREQAAFESEYSTDRPAGDLAGAGRLIFPDWLVEEDRNLVLATAESYLAPLRTAFPRAPWTRLEIMIHPAYPFMAPFRRWVKGCRYNTLVVVSWARLEDGTPRAENPLPTLPHEALHWIAATTGRDSRDAKEGGTWMGSTGRLDRLAQDQAAPCEISEASRATARGYKYEPWVG